MKIITDKEFVARFSGCIGSNDCMFAFKGTTAITCRVVEMYKMWEDGRSFDDILSAMWEICFDLCFDDDTEYFPQSAYDFCKEVIETFNSDFSGDRKVVE